MLNPDLDLSLSRKDNPNKVEFFKQGKTQWISIHCDRGTSITRLATEQDKETYADYLPKLGRPKKDDST